MARTDSYYNQLSQILGMAKPPDFTAQIQAAQARNSQNSGGMFGQSSVPTGTGGGDFQRFVNAISGQESGGNYGSRNSSSGAMGRYQIMPSNLPSWSREALGHSVSAQQFMSNPKIQDAIAQYKLRQYVNRYGFQGAAAAWYGGPGVAQNWSSHNGSQGAYPSIASYVAQIMQRMR